ncbi:hypothetical protein ECHLIB_0524 [Ehrlichia chaffeensis str. Liberty]|nr:hypothetical protein ECHJAX_0523 [Ehrlichia chaffeensis str. Jax]AHX06578.1 hypothetical protein ECHLIB_0524 [Ehrlichia chaffeensis str. Liberty]
MNLICTSSALLHLLVDKIKLQYFLLIKLYNPAQKNQCC